MEFFSAFFSTTKLWIPTILRSFINGGISFFYQVHMTQNIKPFKIYTFLVEYFGIFVNKMGFDLVFLIKLLAAVRRKNGIATVRFLTFFRVEWAIWRTTAERGDTCFNRKTVENTDFAWVKMRRFDQNRWNQPSKIF